MSRVVITALSAALWMMAAVPLRAAEFLCRSGDVTCLIAAINEANTSPGENVINLEPGNYTLQTIDNGTFADANGLPVIGGSIRIQATGEDLPTVIERDLNAPHFRILEVARGANLILSGVTIQRGGGFPVSFIFSPAILNSGETSLENSIISDSRGEFGTIINFGTFRVIRSIIADNVSNHEAGGIVNHPGGNLLVENSTISHNQSQGAGGILNVGSTVVTNSAIISNSTDGVQPGGGIWNRTGGIVEIVNTTIAKNVAGFQGFGGGGGLFNSSGGRVSIINSTIRENVSDQRFAEGGGISNDGGILELQNTIVAGNTGVVGQDCFGMITSLGNNLIGNPPDCDINLQPSDLTGDPGLDTLVGTGENDPPGSAYYPVLAGSVVIDKGSPAVCAKTDQLGNPRVGVCDIGSVEFADGPDGRLLVSIDVRPKRDVNNINPNSTRNINVAVFSGNGFDATTIDPNTVRFGATGTEAAPINVGQRDVNGDGSRDLVFRFMIQDLGIQCGDTSATLTGQTADSQSFSGSSSITARCRAQTASAGSP
jgi:hypothetical protein